MQDTGRRRRPRRTEQATGFNGENERRQSEVARAPYAGVKGGRKRRGEVEEEGLTKAGEGNTVHVRGQQGLKTGAKLDHRLLQQDIYRTVGIRAIEPRMFDYSTWESSGFIAGVAWCGQNP